MPPNDDPTKAAGGQPPDGGDGNAGDGGSDQKWYDKLGEEDVITPRKLQGIITANTATLEKRLETKLGELNKGLAETVKEALKAEREAASGSDGDKKGKPTEQEAEMAKMQRKLEESEGKITALVSNLDDSQKREVATKKRQLIMKALTEAHCDRNEVACKYIEDNVQVEDGKAFVLQDNGYGAQESVPLEEYVQTHVREKLLPELFRGANRSGSPASGEGGGSGSKVFKFDWEKVKDNTEVLISQEFVSALEAGQVSNMSKGVPHTSGSR